ncbi:lachesin-like [Oratosquilla oratoria]|uniref:lachesin-like n=1 Tax=Oratosquilla oratoria TaxID=337810 RepID=UPI003F7751F0
MRPTEGRVYCLQLLLFLHLAVCFEDDNPISDIFRGGTGDGGGDGGGGGGGGGIGVGEDRPRFLHKELETNVSVQLGGTARLHCKVTGLRDQSVSWCRRKGEEIHLLTWGFQTYYNDDRFSLMYEHPHDWRLNIAYVQDRDEGTYECQVSSYPPLILTVHLHVVVPAIQILDDRGVVMPEKFYRTGSTIELQCIVANVPSTSNLQLAWFRDEYRLNYDARRGGVSVKTELRGSVARSWLRVGDAKKADSGTYYCNVTDLASASTLIHVVRDENPAAIQGASCSHSWHGYGFVTLAFLTLHLVKDILISSHCR